MTSTLYKFDGPRGHDISLKLVGHTCKILRYKSSHRYIRSAKNTVVEKINILNLTLPVNLKNQNSKRVKGFDDGEVNKQSVIKIESLFFLEINVIVFKQFPLVGTSFKFYIW